MTNYNNFHYDHFISNSQKSKAINLKIHTIIYGFLIKILHHIEKNNVMFP